MKRRLFCLCVMSALIICLFSVQVCGAELTRGDMNNDTVVSSDDAIYLLRHTLSNSQYPITQNGDVNRDNAVSSDDAIYLLRYTLSNTQYPIGCDVLDHVYSDGVCQYCGAEEEGAFDVARFASDVNYNYLGTLSNGENMQGFYNALDETLTAFHNDTTVDAQVISGETYTWNVVAQNNYVEWGLTIDEADRVWNAYRDDHPLYYWMLEYAYTDTSIFSATFSSYVYGKDRAAYNEQIYEEAAKYVELVKDAKSQYGIAAAYYDAIINDCSVYSFSGSKYYSEIYKECTIIGSLLNKSAYNSGYAKLYQMLLNYSGIENWYAWGSSPLFVGWNLVKLDDGNWYWCDLTLADMNSWDSWDTYQYFCGTSSTLPSGQTAFTTTASPQAPTLSSSEFSVQGIVEIHSNFTVDNVKYKLLNGSNEVIVVDYEFSDRNKIKNSLEYNGVTFSVLDVVDCGGNEINTVMFETNSSYDYLGTLDNGAAMQKLYEELDGKFTAFHLGIDSNVKTITVSDSLYYEFASIDYAKYGLSYSDAAAVWQFYRNDHPLYYWLYYGWVYNNVLGCLYPCTTAEYDTLAERMSCNELVYESIAEYIEKGSGETNTYLLALSYYDAIVDNNDYAYDSSGNAESALWAHSIIGAFDHNEFVCEGYAKLLQLLLNYSNIDNRYITGVAGENHAWNLVKMDDGNWYWCDATWGDPGGKNNIYYSKYFCVTDSGLSTHAPDSTTNIDNPARVLPTLPASSQSAYSNPGVVELWETFTVDSLTYRRIQYNEASCIAGLEMGEAVQDTVVFDGVTYTTVIHLINNINWYHRGDTYKAYCSACQDWVDLYEVSEKTLELTFEEDISTELAKYDGFEAVSPSGYSITTDSSGNKVLSCGNKSLYLDVDRQTLADLKLFAITFDLTITKSGNASSEISILSLLSNHQNGAAIPGKSVGWNWFLKYNVNQKKLESVKSATAPLTEKNSISVQLNTKYEVTVIFDTLAKKAYIDVDGNALGVTTGVTFPDLNDPIYDDALSIRFNDGGNCAPTFDNVRIVAIN